MSVTENGSQLTDRSQMVRDRLHSKKIILIVSSEMYLLAFLQTDEKINTTVMSTYPLPVVKRRGPVASRHAHWRQTMVVALTDHIAGLFFYSNIQVYLRNRLNELCQNMLWKEMNLPFGLLVSFSGRSWWNYDPLKDSVGEESSCLSNTHIENLSNHCFQQQQ